MIDRKIHVFGIKEDKKIASFLIAIAAVLIFTFTIADAVSTVGHVKAPWLYRSDKEIIRELRIELADLNFILSTMNKENKYLRRLVYTAKPDQWTTWLELMDYCKRLEKRIEEQRKKIIILEHKLGILQWRMLEPYRRA